MKRLAPFIFLIFIIGCGESSTNNNEKTDDVSGQERQDVSTDNDEAEELPDSEEEAVTENDIIDETNETDETDETDEEEIPDVDITPGIGVGYRISGKIILFHSTVYPDGNGGFRDISGSLGNIDPCPMEGSLNEDSTYGFVNADVDTPDVAQSPPEVHGNEDYVQMNHSFAGEMGSVILPFNEAGITVVYKYVHGTYTSIVADDINMDGNSINYNYFMSLRCGDPVKTGENLKVGPFQDGICAFFVLKVSGGYTQCMYAVGFSSEDEGYGECISIVEQ